MRAGEELVDKVVNEGDRGIPVGAVEVARARATGRPPLVTPATVAIFEHDWPLDSSAAMAGLSYRVTPLVEGVDRLLTHHN